MKTFSYKLQENQRDLQRQVLDITQDRPGHGNVSTMECMLEPLDSLSDFEEKEEELQEKENRKKMVSFKAQFVIWDIRLDCNAFESYLPLFSLVSIYVTKS